MASDTSAKRERGGIGHNPSALADYGAAGRVRTFVLRATEEVHPVLALHRRGHGVTEELGLWPELADNSYLVLGRDVIERGYGRVVGNCEDERGVRIRCPERDENTMWVGRSALTLFCDVEPARAVGVVISTTEELAQDGVVSVSRARKERSERW